MLRSIEEYDGVDVKKQIPMRVSFRQKQTGSDLLYCKTNIQPFWQLYS